MKGKSLQICDQQNQKFNELATQIQPQIDYIEQDNQQFNTKLSQVDIESYLSGSNLFAEAFDNLQSFKKSLKHQLDEIIKDHKLDELRHQIQLINIQKITLYPETIEKKQKLSDEIDCSLSFLCTAHNQQIVKFDLSGTTAIENRMLCDVCLKYRQGILKI